MTFAYALSGDFPIMSFINFAFLCYAVYTVKESRRQTRRDLESTDQRLELTHRDTALSKAHADQAATASVATNAILGRMAAYHAAQRQPPEPLRVLVAEGEAGTGASLAERLSAHLHVDVDTAADGVEALAMLHARPYAVLVTDLRMPGIDGPELLRAVQAEGIRTDVVIHTGHGTNGDEVEVTRLGAVGFVPKGSDPLVLARPIERALSARSLENEVVRLRAELASLQVESNLP